MESKRLQKLALVVEPDDDVRHLAESLITETELHPVVCSSAEAALAILDEAGSETALLFAEMRLPGELDGLDLACEVERRWPWIDVLIASDCPDRWVAHPANATLIQKPWLPLQVLVEVEKAA